MKKHQYSEYEKYILMSEKDKMNQTYASFLGFKTIVSFIKEIVGKQETLFFIMVLFIRRRSHLMRLLNS